MERNQEIIRFKLNPRGSNTFDTKITECCLNGKAYDFVYAYTLGDPESPEPFYEPVDKNFPSSKPISIYDLLLTKE